MRRWMILALLTGLLAALGGCNNKDEEAAKEAEATAAQMETPEMKEWYNKNANKTPNTEGSSDAIVTGQGVSGAPAQSGAPATN